MTRSINQAGLDLVKHFEGLYTDAYICPAGVPTIGYGHTKNVQMGQTITEPEAEQLLKEDMAGSADAVERTITVVLNDNQFAALTSFTFNVGAGNLRASTLCRKLNGGDYDCVPEELARWVKATNPATGKKRTLAGLVKRRNAEAQLWLTDADGDPTHPMPQEVSVSEPPGKAFSVNARSGLRMRAGPGTEFDTLTVLEPKQQVFTGKQAGDWVEVDLEGDGVVDGWVFQSYLKAKHSR